jgi:hypothetical protein
MKHLLAAVLSLSLIFGPAMPAQASEGGGRDPVEEVVTVVALTILINQILFTPSQLVLLSEGGAFGLIPPDDIEKYDDKKGGGLFGKLLGATRKKIFEELEQKNFVKKIGRAYRIGDMVFVDSMFFDTEFDNEATAAGRAALESILNGNTFALGPASDPFSAMLEQQILAMMFFYHTTESMRSIYRLDPKMNRAGGIEGVSTGAPLNQPLAFLAFFAAIASGLAEPIGNVWQIEDKVVIAAPLEEIFPPEK